MGIKSAYKIILVGNEGDILRDLSITHPKILGKRKTNQILVLDSNRQGRPRYNRLKESKSLTPTANIAVRNKYVITLIIL